MIRIVSSPCLSIKRSPVCFVPLRRRSLEKTICYAILTRKDDSGSYDGDDDEPKKQLNNPNEMDPEQLQTIRSLNKLFYYNYTITYQDLKDLIVGTFKKFYRIGLEVREGQVCFVVYPEVQSEDDIEYKREMDAIALILTDYAMKEHLYAELKKIDIFQRGVVIIPLNMDLQQK